MQPEPRVVFLFFSLFFFLESAFEWATSWTSTQEPDRSGVVCSFQCDDNVRVAGLELRNKRADSFWSDAPTCAIGSGDCPRRVNKDSIDRENRGAAVACCCSIVSQTGRGWNKVKQWNSVSDSAALLDSAGGGVSMLFRRRLLFFCWFWLAQHRRCCCVRQKCFTRIPGLQVLPFLGMQFERRISLHLCWCRDREDSLK